MAHHQHHGPDYDAQVSRTLASRPSSTTLPAISEDDLAAEADEPPDTLPSGFVKTRPAPNSRRLSLLTKAFHNTDSESHDDDHENFEPVGISREHSISSTTSNYSNQSVPDLSSDDGHASTGTRASTPCSPRSMAAYFNPALGSFKPTFKLFANKQEEQRKPEEAVQPSAPVAEPVVEAGLGRKRCITFACSGTKEAQQTKVVTEQKPAEPEKRPCMLKFLCPGRNSVEQGPGKAGPQRTTRRLSPCPTAIASSSPKPSNKRTHRDSDATIKLESPKMMRRRSASRGRRLTKEEDDLDQEATSFHEFCSSEEEIQDWVQETTCHRSRLTVDDTLRKENHLRQLAEEAEEEEEMEGVVDEEDELDDDVDDSPDEFSEEEEVSDTGFQTDDEDGFADSDDDSDCDSDYEWWAPRKTMAASPFVRSRVPRQRQLHRTGSDSSLNSTASPTRRNTKAKSSGPVDIGRPSHDLPDSTDFVCGTLDEDRPLEQEFAIRVEQRKAAKHRVIPQDIDPTFPTSDPEAETDDEDEIDDDEGHARAIESNESSFFHGKFESADEKTTRGRHPNTATFKSPHRSPARVKTPPVPSTKRPLAKSPCPRGLFNHSPRRMRSPAPAARLHSPPPSPRTSHPGLLQRADTDICEAFRTRGDFAPIFTASLPKSPGPLNRRSRASIIVESQDDSEEDEGEETQTESTYTRGAIDIVQGLEQKRLRRRQKFYERYCKYAGKKQQVKREKRPLPGKGAERMRQVGLECAVYRGKRVLSV